MNFDLNKSKSRDAVKVSYDWEVPTDTSYVCVSFNVDHTMICKRDDLSHNAIVNWRIWRRNCLAWCVKTLKSNKFCKTSQEKSRSNRGANTVPDARPDMVAGGSWERRRSAFFDVRVCHPNADSYRDSDPDHILRQHETEKKSQYASRVLKVEQATFTPLVFSMTGGMAVD